MNSKSESLFLLINRLWHHIDNKRRNQFGALLILMLIVTFAELLSIGAVVPFLAIIAAPEKIFTHTNMQPVIQFLEITESNQLLLFLTIIFGISALFAGGLRLLLLWISTRLSFLTGAELSANMYSRTLFQSYAVHCSRNSSEIINGISGKANVIIYNVIVPILNLVSALIMLFAILIALLLTEPIIAIFSFGGFGILYYIIIRFTRKQQIMDSNRIAQESSNVIKSLQEGLGGIRDVLIDGTQEIYCKVYRNADLTLRRAQANNLFISISPRFVMEVLGMLFISLIAYSVTLENDNTNVIPILGALALGAQRLLPFLQQAYSSWTTIRGTQASLKDILILLDQPIPSHDKNKISYPLNFKKNITIENLGFRYNLQSAYVLKDLNLTIEKGSCVGFIGTTGSGKSTLLDILMGLLEPTNGQLKIDGQVISSNNNHAWQYHIAHVPQNIFLADSSIEENIAFGVPKKEIDNNRVKEAAQLAQLSNVIEALPDQYQTIVGERGIRLSGGQRQRIGIARAFYKKADIMIFDEATSSLDTETEQAVMKAIQNYSKNLTLLIIAHRLSTLENCTKIVELDNGRIKRIGLYSDIVGLKDNFKIN